MAMLAYWRAELLSAAFEEFAGIRQNLFTNLNAATYVQRAGIVADGFAGPFDRSLYITETQEVQRCNKG